MGNKPIVGGWQSVAVVLISVSALLLTAKVSAIRRAKSKQAQAGLQAKIPPGVDYGKGLGTKAA
jgi:hypothetical protein